MSTGKIILGAVAGLAVGAALGVLFVPDKGFETRKKLSKKKDDLAGNLKGKFDNLKGKYNTALDSAADKLDSLAAKGEELAQNGKQAVSDAKSAITR